MHIKNLFSKILLTLAVIVIAMSACKNDIDLLKIDPSIEFNPSLVFPVGEVNFTVVDIFKSFGNDTTIVFGNDGSMKMALKLEDDNLLFRASIAQSWRMDTIKIRPEMNVTRSTFPSDIHVPAVPNLPGMPDSYEVVSTFEDFMVFMDGTDGERIDSGKISMLSAGIKLSGALLTDIPQIQKVNVKMQLDPDYICYTNGAPVTDSLIFNRADTETDVFKFMDLRNLVIKKMKSKNNDGADIGVPFTITIKVTAGLGGGAYTIPANKEFTFSFVPDNAAFHFEYLYGQFSPSRNLLEQTETFAFELPDDSYFPFLDPEIAMDIKSYTGMPLKLNIDYLKAYREGTDTVANPPVYATWGGSRNKNIIIIPQSVLDGAPGNTEESPIKRDNGNPFLLFANSTMRPNRVEYRFTASIPSDTEILARFPDFDISKPHFIRMNDSIHVIANTTIPVYLDQTAKVGYSDTIAGLGDSFNSIFEQYDQFQDYADKININGIGLHLELENGLPFHLLDSIIYLREDGSKIGFDTGTDGFKIIKYANKQDTIGQEVDFLDIPSATVRTDLPMYDDRDGLATSPSTVRYSIFIRTLDNINALRTLKSVIMRFDLDGQNNDNPSQHHRIRLLGTDSVKIRLAVTAGATAKISKEKFEELIKGGENK